ncbi:hypothetical protein RvY_17577 [Ramazzottius varieornatus]|uniref:Spaetzle domain-containing protein n=1 Tax=Ramazzottius varieornatus TaxID=947166 RepID=A0A1D1W2L5_RAMVA|nr:hypothetical protein RvY_17577 [Ramazzottius varieornatus]
MKEFRLLGFIFCVLPYTGAQTYNAYPASYGTPSYGTPASSYQYNPQTQQSAYYMPVQGASQLPSAITARADLDCNYNKDSGPLCKRTKLSPFMCHHNDNYPRESANEIEKNYGSTFKGLSITEVDVWDVYDGPISEDKDSICESDIELIRPGYAKNVKDQWKAVMQGTDVTQTVRVERCLRPGSTCKHVPGCYETTCKQRYSFVRLLVFDPCNRFSGPTYDMFRLPTACDCQLTPKKASSNANGIPGMPGGGFGMPDFNMADQMKNVEGAGFGNIPSGRTVMNG